jgi:hypothetical protein
VFIMHLSKFQLIALRDDSGDTDVPGAFLHAGVSPSVKVFIVPTRSTFGRFISARLAVFRALCTDAVSRKCVIDGVIERTGVMALLIQVMTRLFHHESPVDGVLLLSQLIVVL